MAAALCYGIGGGATVAFHVQAGSYDTASLIGVLKQLRRFLGGQKATLVWDGLGAHRSRAMRAFLAIQRDWLVVEQLPAYAPDLNPVQALWSNLKGQELANLACDTLGEVIQATRQGIERIRRAWWLPYSFLRPTVPPGRQPYRRTRVRACLGTRRPPLILVGGDSSARARSASSLCNRP